MWRDAARLISIHALLAESDNPGQPVRGLPSYFYPRSPCGERRARNSLHRQRKNHFYPRSPCGERPAGGGDLHAGCRISIHALLAESDFSIDWYATGGIIFLSTLSLRRATRRFWARRCSPGISIHALLAESDNVWACSAGYVCLFLSTLSLRRATSTTDQLKAKQQISIHALLAESDGLYDTYAKVLRVFLSTLSLRRATVGVIPVILII